MTTIAELITEVRQKADMVSSSFVTDTEILRMLNRAWQFLYETISKEGSGYISSTTLTTTSAEEYPLPADFWKILGADVVDGGRTVSLRAFNFKDRNRNSGAPSSTYPAYQLRNSSLRLMPAPSPGLSVTVWYTPRPILFTAVSDVVDVPYFGEEFLAVSGAIECLAKEESDTNVLQLHRQQLLIQIQNSLQRDTSGDASYVTDLNDDYSALYTHRFRG